jgi:hypothetical protein
MRRFLSAPGSILPPLVAFAVVGFLSISEKGNALNQESKAWVDRAVPAILSNGDKQQLLMRASPEFRQCVKGDELDKLFASFHRLGHLVSYDGAHGFCRDTYTSSGKVISASNTASANFDTGPATIRIGVIQHDLEWQILCFRVESRVLDER